MGRRSLLITPPPPFTDGRRYRTRRPQRKVVEIKVETIAATHSPLESRCLQGSEQKIPNLINNCLLHRPPAARWLFLSKHPRY